MAPMALAVLVGFGAVAGCSSDGERATTTSTTTPPTHHDLARRACTEVLDERSELVSRRASDASTLLRSALDDPDEPDDQVVDEIRDALGAERGQLADAQTLLRAVVVPDADRQDWATVVESVAPLLADLDDTLAFLREPDWTRGADAIGLQTPTPDRAALDAALDRLELLGSDCEWVYDYPGDPAGAAPFHREAAAACATTVERRRDEGFDPAAAATAERDAERAATRTDLTAVETITLDEPARWDRFVTLVDELTATGGETDSDGDLPDARLAEELEALGLDQRPCAALGR